jgi:di/tricarboxylate transporter
LEPTRFFRRTVRTLSDEAKIAKGDILFVDVAVADADRQRLGLEKLPMTEDFFASYSRRVGMAEVMIAPQSTAVGARVRDLRLRTTHDLVVLGVRHSGRSVGASYPTLRLAAGDTLLVSGGWDAVKRLQASTRDYVVLDLPAEVDEVAPAANQAPFALLSVIVMVVLMVTGIVPNVIAALIACLLLGVFRCIDMPSAYRSGCFRSR